MIKVRRPVLVLPAISIAAAMLTACTNGSASAPPRPFSSSPSPSSPSGSPTTPPAPHVFLIVFENHAYEQIIGDPDAPYLNELARRYGLATNYRAITHPSLPNYLAMIGGSTSGITDDCNSCEASGPNLADQIEARGLTWRGYFESMPEPCFKEASSGEYAKKHNPFMYFPSISSNETRCREHVVPLTALSSDLSADSVPTFSMIIPGGCHDMHDCSVREGDDWLRGFLPDILRAPAYLDGGVVVVTFDEDNGGANNHIATIVISPRVAPGTRAAQRYDHYSLLRGMEDLFGLSHLGHAGDPGQRSVFGGFFSAS